MHVQRLFRQNEDEHPGQGQRPKWKKEAKRANETRGHRFVLACERGQLIPSIIFYHCRVLPPMEALRP